MTESRRRARGSLSREEILSCARQLLERDRLVDLTFPRLAKQLDASPSSIYSYFGTKDELLAAIVDDVTTELYLRFPRVGDGPWDSAIVTHFVACRELIGSRSIYREVFAYRAQSLFRGSRMAPFVLQRVESLLALFVRSGLTPNEAVQAVHAFSSYTRAFVLVEQGLEEEGDERTQQLSDVVLKQAAAALPMVAQVENFAQLQDLGPDLYREGLELLVEGLCEAHPALSTTRATSSTASTDESVA